MELSVHLVVCCFCVLLCRSPVEFSDGVDDDDSCFLEEWRECCDFVALLLEVFCFDEEGVVQVVLPLFSADLLEALEVKPVFCVYEERFFSLVDTPLCSLQGKSCFSCSCAAIDHGDFFV